MRSAIVPRWTVPFQSLSKQARLNCPERAGPRDLGLPKPFCPSKQISRPCETGYYCRRVGRMSNLHIVDGGVIFVVLAKVKSQRQLYSLSHHRLWPAEV